MKLKTLLKAAKT